MSRLPSRSLPESVSGIIDEFRTSYGGRSHKEPLLVSFDRFCGALALWQNNHQNAATRLAADGPALAAALRTEGNAVLAGRLDAALPSLS